MIKNRKTRKDPRYQHKRKELVRGGGYYDCDFDAEDEPVSRVQRVLAKNKEKYFLQENV